MVILFQVQAKHWGCTRWGSGVSCVCGVAMREDETILIADMCHNESAVGDLKFLTYNDNEIPDDAGIKVSASGRTFKACDTIIQLLLTK